MIKLESYNEIYLEKSWGWLNDPEIKFLTNTPDFTKEDQQKWYRSIQSKENYKIWGVSAENNPIGVFGIKNIDYKKADGEYWGFIGEKEYWGKGIGKSILEQLIEIAKNDLRLKEIYLKVIRENEIAIKLYKKLDFKEIGVDAENIIMKKNIASL